MSYGQWVKVSIKWPFKVMLDKITDEMLERLESQLSDTIAFISHFIAQAEDDSNKLFLPCLRWVSNNSIFHVYGFSRFLSNWLDCEERAETSHNIGSELLCCARLARKNDHDLFARFVSGFYKATNSESAAVHYFEKTDLIQTLLDSLNLENGHCQTLIGQGIRFIWLILVGCSWQYFTPTISRQVTLHREFPWWHW